MADAPRRSLVRWTLLILGVAVGAGLLAARPLVGWGVRRWAASQQLDLRFQRLGLESGRLVLEGVEVQTPALERIQISSAKATLHVKHWAPELLHLDAPRLVFSGTHKEAVARLGTWLKGVKMPPGVSFTASSVSLIGQAPGESSPWLELDGASATPSRQGHQILIHQVRMGAMNLRDVRFFWIPQKEGYEIAFFEPVGSFPLRVKFFPHQAEPLLRLELNRFPIKELAALGLPVPDEAKKVEAEGSFETTLGAEPSQGKLSLVLHGYTPPHPPEVDSLVRSDRTSIEANVKLLPKEDRSLLEVSPLSVTSGQLHLQGSGEGTLLPDHATFRGTLRGSLPCREVARSAAGADLDGFLGGVAVGLASLLKGSVQLSVQMTADSRNLGATSFRTSATPRCSVSF